MRILTIVIIVLLLLGSYMIVKSNNLDIENQKDQKTFIKLFSTWVTSLINNIKDLTVQAVKQDWLPETNNTKK